MPIYEYLCSDCGNRFDVRQSFSDEPVTVCTQCGASVRRVLYPAGVIFKGSGWYVTDSRKSSSAAVNSSSSESSSESGSGDGASEKKASESTASSTKKEPAAAANDD
jgi:putative FmdB family regulatory protein